MNKDKRKKGYRKGVLARESEFFGALGEVEAAEARLGRLLVAEFVLRQKHLRSTKHRTLMVNK